MSGVLTEVFYAVQQNMKVSFRLCQPQTLFQASHQNHIHKNVDFEAREPRVQKC